MSKSVLENIVDDRRKSIKAEKARINMDHLRSMVMASPTPLSLSAVMKMPGIGLIAEIKKARPGVGVLKENLSVPALAEAYLTGGASAISVLTEPEHFQGSWMFLRAAKEFSSLLALCKDFIIDEFQLEMARGYGADAVLLIAATLDDLALRKMIKAAHNLEMEVLTEAINAQELDRVRASDTDLIGINSRNLHTLDVDLDGALDLAAKVDDERPIVIESGIHTRADVVKTAEAGADGILVGSALMEAADPVAKIEELLNNEKPEW